MTMERVSNHQVRIRPTYSRDPKSYSLFCGSHAVRTTVTAKSAVVRSWICAVRHRHRFQLRRRRLVVGLGVQWAPLRRDVAATLQLCVGSKCLIFQLGYAQSPAVLRRFLSDTDVIFVGIWNYRDAKLLAESMHRLCVAQLLDLRVIASELRGLSRRSSMEKLAAEILGMPGMVKDEWVGRSDWSVRWLSEEQVQYACLDTFLAFLIGKELHAWNWVDDVDE